MSISTSITKQVLKLYEQDRDNAQKQLLHRKEMVYRQQPRIKEIDQRIALAGLEAAKTALGEPGKASKMANTLKDTVTALLTQKQVLLAELGYAENYLEITYQCLNCKDTGFIQNKKCSCFTQKLITLTVEQYNINDDFNNENFDNFDIRYYSAEIEPNENISPQEHMKTVLTTCLTFVNNFESHFNNLLLYGKTGLGKTFLCHCIAREILLKGHTAVYMTAFQLFKRIENIRFNKTQEEDEPQNYDYLLEADLFIIDDLGSEFSTILTSSEFFNIINSRLSLKKPTIISTNLSPDEFSSQYSDRTVSRLLGHYTLLRFFGNDIRLLKKYNKSTK